MTRCFALMLCLAFGSAHAAPEGWTEDCEAALATARESGRGVLVYFTCSDASGWCSTLQRDVFDTAAFRTYAAAHWVLVFVDFPESATPADPRRNEQLKERHRVEGFPTVVLLDASGQELGRISDPDGDPPRRAEQFVARLEHHRLYPLLRAQLAARAASAPDEPSRQRLYLELVQTAVALDRVGEVADEVAIADPTNARGLWTVLRIDILLREQDRIARLEPAQRAPQLARVLADCDAFETRFPLKPGEPTQRYYLAKGELHSVGGQQQALLACFAAAYRAHPTGPLGPRLRQFLAKHGLTVSDPPAGD